MLKKIIDIILWPYTRIKREIQFRRKIKELKKREEALQTYRDALELLERQYREEQERIDERTEERRESLEESHSERPQDVIDEIISQFGFEYVE